ncbi:MAG TPA: aminotransferase class I/II-fold pyridoxal phosphate-dependent enzyme [Acidimicrobiia bacterium]|nr:aminotransferase class I/II-fold pyridoxal phosphate-dependent enzyme [Acidimicrobiia bacterium]
MSFFQQRLEAFPRIDDYRLAKSSGYWPYYKTVESASKPRFTIEGSEYINFGSNNYLSLSYHPEVIEAANRATSKYGTGVTGSRLLNGTLDLHRELEAELADFYGREAALVFSTGYVANVSTIGGLLHRHDYVVLDKDAHNSLLTGAQLSGATMKRFGHNDLDRLAKILAELPADAGKGVIVDGVYSMGGDTAPLVELVELCRSHPNTFLLDDEAHGLGVLGAHGRGAAEYHGVVADVDLVTITFSKTLGSCGGALVGSADAVELLTLDSDPLIFTASNTPGSLAAALVALRILRRDPSMPARLQANVQRFVDLLTERSVPVNTPESAIITIPLRQRDEVSAVMLARELLDAGVFVNPVVAPAVARGLGLIRLSLMLDHTPALLEEAAEVIYKVMNENDQLPAEEDALAPTR